MAISMMPTSMTTITSMTKSKYDSIWENMITIMATMTTIMTIITVTDIAMEATIMAMI